MNSKSIHDLREEQQRLSVGQIVLVNSGAVALILSVKDLPESENTFCKQRYRVWLSTHKGSFFDTRFSGWRVKVIA